ncbi:flagellar motor protein MotD [Alkalimarinus alittae]|uniref:Flagellar motor protein MotD n=1 Tax=Alkalimarinus alittae TaxID=2961619 RepID=A0ABY6N7R5_9ALTE|nr:flagellar motor protein MotD [Alkalimarinus alittae]UZE98044.1 flagellar motor protein MotD [Alkalimarinus alittae]
MRRHKEEEESHNKERWLVSYADFITLLFAFFVVMYSVSSVNEGKYKVLSKTLEGAFNTVQRTTKPIQVGEFSPLSEDDNASDQQIQPIDTIPRGSDGQINDRTKGMRALADKFSAEFSGLITDGLVSVNENKDWVEVSLSNKILFKSGDIEPDAGAFPILEQIAAILKPQDNALLIEGFTDNIPIRTRAHPSNWELSSARSAAVVRLLAEEGLDPSKMAAIGYGQFQPVARNDTPEGRSRNRRIVLVISKDPNVRATLRN